MHLIGVEELRLPEDQKAYSELYHIRIDCTIEKYIRYRASTAEADMEKRMPPYQLQELLLKLKIFIVKLMGMYNAKEAEEPNLFFKEHAVFVLFDNKFFMHLLNHNRQHFHVIRASLSNNGDHFLDPQFYTKTMAVFVMILFDVWKEFLAILGNDPEAQEEITEDILRRLNKEFYRLQMIEIEQLELQDTTTMTIEAHEYLEYMLMCHHRR